MYCHWHSFLLIVTVPSNLSGLNHCVNVMSRTASLLSSFWLRPSHFSAQHVYSFWLLLYQKHGEGVTAKGVTAFWDISSVLDHLLPCQQKQIVERIWHSVAYTIRSSTRSPVSTLHQGQLSFSHPIGWDQVCFLLNLSYSFLLFLYQKHGEDVTAKGVTAFLRH